MAATGAATCSISIPAVGGNSEEQATATLSFENIVRHYGPLVQRIALSYEADLERRKELHQDVLVALWRALPSFRHASSLRTFVARIAHNRCISHVARESSAPRVTPLSESEASQQPSPLETAERDNHLSRLRQAVRRLPLGIGEPVVLTLEGFTPREIACVLGLSPNIVSIRLTRAKAALRSALADFDR